jgi:hypothetical protein
MIRHLLCLSSVVAVLAGSVASASDIRRVVTGLDANDKAVVLFDSRVQFKAPPARPALANLWTTDSSPPGFSFKEDAGLRPVSLLPPDNGTVLRVIEFPPLDPAEEAKLDANLLMKVVGDHAPTRGRPIKHPLMHRTRTLDYGVVLSGEIDMMLDDATLHFIAGDVVVMQATNHAWINHGTQPCRMLFVLMDSKQP